MSLLRSAIFSLLLFFSTSVAAHEVRPGYLSIQQVDTATYDLLWRVPARGQKRLALYVRLPKTCFNQGKVQAWYQGGMHIERWTSMCSEGLKDHAVEIDGLTSVMTDVLVRYVRLDGTIQVVRLTPSMDSFIVSDSENWQEIVTTYVSFGVEHILYGIDHLLFVLALLMIVSNWRKLVATVTAFTIAHSLTLTAATLGWVNIPQQPVEAVIALSILFVAVEIVHWHQGKEGISRRKPWLVAFVFGLLHGFGFAGALNEIGLPEQAIPLALLFFNLGVEAGQLIFITLIIMAWSVLKKMPWPVWTWRIPVYGIGTLAAFWTIERISGF